MLKLYIPKATPVYQTQEKKKVDQVSDLGKFQKLSEGFKRGPNYRMKRLDVILGVSVWLVSGDKIRGTKKRPGIDVDFTCGGHGYRYLYIPLNEIWIDGGLKREDVRPTIWHEFTERHLMERGWDYNKAHDYAARVEIGIRDGEEFVLPVTNYTQSNGYACGAVALRIVLEYLALELTEKELMKLANTTPATGTDPKNMVAAAHKLGFEVQHKEGWTPNQVKKTLENGLPIIANYQESPEEGEGHYAVIIGYTKDEFIFSNPSKGEDFTLIKVADFMERWHELEDDTKQEGIVIS